jgi:hypothetical protein
LRHHQDIAGFGKKSLVLHRGRNGGGQIVAGLEHRQAEQRDNLHRLPGSPCRC